MLYIAVVIAALLAVVLQMLLYRKKGLKNSHTAPVFPPARSSRVTTFIFSRRSKTEADCLCRT